MRFINYKYNCKNDLCLLTPSTLIHLDCGGVSILEPGHAGELLPICSAPKCLQRSVQVLHRHSGVKTCC